MSSLCESSAASTRAFYSNRRVLVVGGDGFLGYNCVVSLHSLGAVVSILTRSRVSRAASFASRVFKGDLRDRILAARAVMDQEVVIDFAGASGAVTSNAEPVRNLDQDCRAQLTLFDVCAREEGPMLVFASSRLVYGRSQYLPVDEKHPLAPQSIYAVHKLAEEQYLRVLAEARGLRYCVLRLSNPYGPHQPGGRRDYGVINQFIRAACAGKTIVVYGRGDQKRDYIYVDDAITAFLRCGASAACRGQTFNLGGRTPISIADAALFITRAARSGEVRFEDWPGEYRTVETGDYTSDLRRLDACVSLPEPVSFEDGVCRSIEYYRHGLERQNANLRTTEPPLTVLYGV